MWGPAKKSTWRCPPPPSAGAGGLKSIRKLRTHELWGFFGTSTTWALTYCRVLLLFTLTDCNINDWWLPSFGTMCPCIVILIWQMDQLRHRLDNVSFYHSLAPTEGTPEILNRSSVNLPGTHGHRTRWLRDASPAVEKSAGDVPLEIRIFQSLFS